MSEFLCVRSCFLFPFAFVCLGLKIFNVFCVFYVCRILFLSLFVCWKENE